MDTWLANTSMVPRDLDVHLLVFYLFVDKSAMPGATLALLISIWDNFPRTGTG